MELWKDVPTFEGKYNVSNWGRIKSNARTILREECAHSRAHLVFYKEKILKVNRSVYPIVTLVKTTDEPLYHIRLHKLVALVFIGEKPKGTEIRHLDGNPKNCRADNLKYGTRQENLEDARLHKIKRGCGHGSKINYDDIVKIRENSQNSSHAKLGIEYGVSGRTITRIIRRETYKHI